MDFVGLAELASAVRNAGGLGSRATRYLLSPVIGRPQHIINMIFRFIACVRIRGVAN
jgi:hypothetical protein